MLADPRAGTAAQALGIAERLGRPFRTLDLAWGPLARLPLPLPTLAGLADPATFRDTGHTEWVCGRTLQTGFTTAFPPGTAVTYTHTDGAKYDIDICGIREGLSATVATSAAVTSRSHHAGVVSTSLMDGSVRAVSSSIDGGLWRTLSTRAGNETVPNDF